MRKSKLSKSLRHNQLKSFTVVIGLLILVGIGIVYAVRERARVAVVTEPNPDCTFDFSINKPSPSPSPSASPSLSPSPSPSLPSSPKPSICVITTIPADHTAVCWKNPQQATLKVHVDSLPGNPPYYLVSDWQLVAPTVGPNHTQTLAQEIKVGDTYTLTADWPGIPSGSKDTIDIIVGYNVREGGVNGRLLGGACAKGFNYYWTPWVPCP